ncbi:hypothetical protein M0R45_015728 [Rubus argutus]|uniref:Uncharacterized protein n=1 Tax=Rubus argutus TaxID=59490 RepID=A0AAW1XRG8_RUBAR
MGAMPELNIGDVVVVAARARRSCCFEGNLQVWQWLLDDEVGVPREDRRHSGSRLPTSPPTLASPCSSTQSVAAHCHNQTVPPHHHLCEIKQEGATVNHSSPHRAQATATAAETQATADLCLASVNPPRRHRLSLQHRQRRQSKIDFSPPLNLKAKLLLWAFNPFSRRIPASFPAARTRVLLGPSLYLGLTGSSVTITHSLFNINYSFLN